LADKKFNIMDTAAGKQLAKAAGISAAGASSKNDKSYAKSIKDKAEAAEKEAPKVSEEAKKQLREETARTVAAGRENTKKQLEATKSMTKETAEAVKKVAEEQKKGLEQQHKDAQEGLRKQEEIKRKNDALHEQVLRQIGDGPERHVVEERRQEQMRGEEANIERARARVNDVQSKLRTVDTTAMHEVKLADGRTVTSSVRGATAELRRAEEQYDRHEADTVKFATEAANKATKHLEEAAHHVAVEIGRQKGGILDADKVADTVRSLQKKHASTEGKMRDILAAMNHEKSGGDGGGAEEEHH
jgi:myosin heavy subunit